MHGFWREGTNAFLSMFSPMIIDLVTIYTLPYLAEATRKQSQPNRIGNRDHNGCGHGISPESSASNCAMRLLVGKRQGLQTCSTVLNKLSGSTSIFLREREIVIGILVSCGQSPTAISSRELHRSLPE
uniref:Uncharacterized protein n=1 Tax=Populus davidiana TaxID=266767 RepID=A0A6M2F8T3_9ROSI